MVQSGKNYPHLCHPPPGTRRIQSYQSVAERDCADSISQHTSAAATCAAGGAWNNSENIGAVPSIPASASLIEHDRAGSHVQWPSGIDSASASSRATTTTTVIRVYPFAAVPAVSASVAANCAGFHAQSPKVKNPGATAPRVTVAPGSTITTAAGCVTRNSAGL
jgi:hypothetical protein